MADYKGLGKPGPFVMPILVNARKKGGYVSVEAILEKTTEYQIYRHFLRRNFTVNRAFSSPFHKDNNPSFLIGNKGGFYYHLDFTDPMYRGNCFQFVMQLHHVSFEEALVMINEELCLGIGERKAVVVVKYDEPVIEKAYRTIQVVPKKFTPEELKYWSEYYQGIPELTAENVFSVGKLFLDKERFILGDNNMTFGYLYEDKYWKIYRPRIKGKGKWISSVPLQVVDGLDKVKGCKKTIVAKAKKDKMIFNYFTCACAVQNESIAAFGEDTVTMLKEETETVYVAFDSDEPGVKSSWQVTKQFGWKHLNVPYSYLEEGVKDFSDLCKKHGLRKVKEYLREKNVI